MLAVLWSLSQRGFTLHFAGGGGGAFARELEEAGLLCHTVVIGGRQRRRLLGLSAGPRVDDEEAGG